jgi:hypothetical protein
LQFGVYELDDMPGHDVFHNRYLLTEFGGVSLGHGVDLSEKDAPSAGTRSLRSKVAPICRHDWLYDFVAGLIVNCFSPERAGIAVFYAKFLQNRNSVV